MALNIARAKAVFCVATSLYVLAVMSSTAQEQSHDDEGPIHALARAVGLAEQPAPPPDFVVQSRAAAPKDTIPVFRAPDEPTSTVRSADDVKKSGEGFDKTAAAHKKLLAGAPQPAEPENKAKKPKKPQPSAQATN